MPSRRDLGPLLDGLSVLASIGDMVPFFGAPVTASAEALKQIIEYTEVGV
jgi:hypothetical protein